MRWKWIHMGKKLIRLHHGQAAGYKRASWSKLYVFFGGMIRVDNTRNCLIRRL
jgi:hypothetical protein